MSKQKVIKITKENRNEVREYFRDKNVDCNLYSIGYFYGLTDNGYVVLRSNELSGVRIVQNLSDLEEKPEKTFPRMMMVGSRKDSLNKGLVFFIDLRENVPNSVIATKDIDLYIDKGNYLIDGYEFAEEIPEPIEITRAQIKEWAGGEFEIID